MPKIIELTVEIVVQRVSCPGVWLCQDGRVSLTVFALGTSYQTCMLPPMFPLMFRDVFYFRKRFQETCALNNMCCLLKDETIYCELVQWCQDCVSNECIILAQYLGSLNDVLFPPNMCTSDGVDLLMRRSKEFPGILSPKIEIATKVRIDEIWNERTRSPSFSSMRLRPCQCASADGPRQKPVCHSAQYHSADPRQKPVCHSARYHRTKCVSPKRLPSATQARSRSRSAGSRSCCSLQEPKSEQEGACRCPRSSDQDRDMVGNEESGTKLTLESRFIDDDRYERFHEMKQCKALKLKRYDKINVEPCVCEICKRYHELFHTDYSKS